jgi:hypothetical protein
MDIREFGKEEEEAADRLLVPLVPLGIAGL